LDPFPVCTVCIFGKLEKSQNKEYCDIKEQRKMLSSQQGIKQPISGKA
jgi:hypothetical protein